jgi:hypothetical protein
MSEKTTNLCNKVADIKYDVQQVLDELYRLDNEHDEHFTQFLIAQALMSRPYFDEGHDYEDVWLIAGRLLRGYLDSDFPNQGSDFQVVDQYLETIPVSELNSI